MNRTAVILTAAFAVGATGTGTLGNARDRPVRETASAPADNTKVNERDGNLDTNLPTDQPNNRADLELASAVRKAIEDDSSLSTLAHNVKLVASGGVVSLRGPVANPGEKARVHDIARRVAGVKRVDDQLDIKRNQ